MSVRAADKSKITRKRDGAKSLERAIGFAQRAANTVEKVVQAATPLGALVAKLLV
jgi:hypothetical protein